MAPVTHIVAFKLKSDQADAAQQLYDNFLALQDKCVRESDMQPYITNLRGGKQISPEGMHKDMQFVFTMDFETLEDRDYYLSKDPAHDVFKTFVGGIAADAVVLDFVAGQQ